jgi:hypothetical protein
MGVPGSLPVLVRRSSGRRLRKSGPRLRVQPFQMYVGFHLVRELKLCIIYCIAREGN